MNEVINQINNYQSFIQLIKQLLIFKVRVLKYKRECKVKI
jgi:hypothetical protein